MTQERIPRATYASLYGVAIASGIPETLALALHGLSAAAALVAALLVFRRNEAATSAAALAAATMLISPYLFFYDALLLVTGAGALASRVSEPGARWAMAAAFLAGALQLALGHVAALPSAGGGSCLMRRSALGAVSAPAVSAAPRPAR